MINHLIRKIPTPTQIEMLCQFDYQTSIPMAEIIRYAIASGKRMSEIVEIYPYDQRIIAHRFTIACHTLGITNMRFHDLRRYHCSNKLKAA